MGGLTVRYVDYSDETSRFQVRGIDLTAGNYTAQTGLADALADAVDDVVLGNQVRREVSAYEVNTPKVLPTDKTAQVELKWLVEAVDAVSGQAVRITIPTANPELIANNTDLMDIGTGVGAALVSALEAYARSVAGNAITVTKVRLVGRNL